MSYKFLQDKLEVFINFSVGLSNKQEAIDSYAIEYNEIDACIANKLKAEDLLKLVVDQKSNMGYYEQIDLKVNFEKYDEDNIAIYKIGAKFILNLDNIKNIKEKIQNSLFSLVKEDMSIEECLFNELCWDSTSSLIGRGVFFDEIKYLDPLDINLAYSLLEKSFLDKVSRQCVENINKKNKIL